SEGDVVDVGGAGIRARAVDMGLAGRTRLAAVDLAPPVERSAADRGRVIEAELHERDRGGHVDDLRGVLFGLHRSDADLTPAVGAPAVEDAAGVDRARVPIAEGDLLGRPESDDIGEQWVRVGIEIVSAELPEV